jgi:hypothetical protein
MPKHDPPGDDAALLELERELMELDRAIRAADENRGAINYALFDRRDELMARIFNTPAAGLAGLAVHRANGSQNPVRDRGRDASARRQDHRALGCGQSLFSHAATRRACRHAEGVNRRTEE